MTTEHKERNRWLFLIAILKLIKAALLITVAIGALSVLHKDVQEVLTYRIGQLGVDPNGRYMQRVIELANMGTPKRLVMVSLGSFFYASLFAVEGIGLMMQKRWAEYFTAIVTGSFLPLEIYEFTRHPTKFKAIVIAVNIAIVVYLVVQLRKRTNSASEA